MTPFLASLKGKVTIAMKGRSLLRSLCESFQDRSRIGCAVTDETSALGSLQKEPDELLICTDCLEEGNGFDRARKARELQRPIKVVVLAVTGGHAYRSPSLRSALLPYRSGPRLTPREHAVLDLLASGLSDREMAQKLVVSEETARTYTKRLLKPLDVNNRPQAVLKGVRCGMVQL